MMKEKYNSKCIAPKCNREAKYFDKKYCQPHYLKIKRYGKLIDIVCEICNRPTKQQKKKKKKNGNPK